jgi:hypothetical protein
MKRWLKRLYAQTVWAPGGVPEDLWEVRGIFRWVLPLTDVFFLWFGAVGFTNGIGSVEGLTSERWQLWWSLCLAVSAFGALVGVAFPKLRRFELFSKLALVGTVSVYILVFIYRGAQDPQIAPTAGLVCNLVLLPIWRIFHISGRSWKKRIKRRQAS